MQAPNFRLIDKPKGGRPRHAPAAIVEGFSINLNASLAEMVLAQGTHVERYYDDARRLVGIVPGSAGVKLIFHHCQAKFPAGQIIRDGDFAHGDRFKFAGIRTVDGKTAYVLEAL